MVCGTIGTNHTKHLRYVTPWFFNLEYAFTFQLTHARLPEKAKIQEFKCQCKSMLQAEPITSDAHGATSSLRGTNIKSGARNTNSSAYFT